jgi:AraC family transcriptional activator of pobA
MIPRYGLYGEPSAEITEDFLHLEPIEARSRPCAWRIEPHGHDRLHQMLHIRKGGGAVSIDTSTIEIPGPCLIVVPSGVVHAFRFQPETEGSVASLARHWPNLLPPGLHAEIGLLFDEPRFLPLPEDRAAGPDLDRAFALLMEEWLGDGPYRHTAVVAPLLRIIVLALRLLGEQRVPPLAVTADALLVARFRQRVDASFSRHLPVSVYAQEMGVSLRRLNEACRVVLGVPPLSVIHDRALTEARHLLRYTESSIAQIAYALGFSDASYFSRFFHRLAGCSPTEYRARFPSPSAERPVPLPSGRQGAKVPHKRQNVPGQGRKRVSIVADHGKTR